MKKNNTNQKDKIINLIQKNLKILNIIFFLADKESYFKVNWEKEELKSIISLNLFILLIWNGAEVHHV